MSPCELNKAFQLNIQTEGHQGRTLCMLTAVDSILSVQQQKQWRTKVKVKETDPPWSQIQFFPVKIVPSPCDDLNAVWGLILTPSWNLTISMLIVVQSLSCVRLFAILWTAAHQASLSITNSQSLLKLTSIESVMPSNHLILCHLLLFLPSIFPSIRVFF